MVFIPAHALQGQKERLVPLGHRFETCRCLTALCPKQVLIHRKTKTSAGTDIQSTDRVHVRCLFCGRFERSQKGRFNQDWKPADGIAALAAWQKVDLPLRLDDANAALRIARNAAAAKAFRFPTNQGSLLSTGVLLGAAIGGLAGYYGAAFVGVDTVKGTLAGCVAGLVLAPIALIVTVNRRRDVQYRRSILAGLLELGFPGQAIDHAVTDAGGTALGRDGSMPRDGNPLSRGR